MNHDVQINEIGDGVFSLHGELSFATAPDIMARGLTLIQRAPGITLDLGGIGRSDSAGLALLLGWTRHARRQRKTIAFINMPEQMLVIARLTGLDKILPLE